LGSGDKIAKTKPFNRSVDSYLYYLAVIKPDGKRRILLVDKRDRPFDIRVLGATGGQEDPVDLTTRFDRAASVKLTREDHTKRTVSRSGHTSLGFEVKVS